MHLEKELDALYRRPLSEFVGARNELAKRLTRKGRKKAAERVKALAKPTLTAWAVNQLALTAPDEIAALAAAGAAVRAAHLGAVGEQQAAAAKRRDAISTLLERAEAVLAQAGQTMGRSHRQRISRTLEALSSRGPEDDGPAAGRLGQDLEPPGFEALADLAAALGQVQAKRAARPAPAARSSPVDQTTEASKHEPDLAASLAVRGDRRGEIARGKLDRQLQDVSRAIDDLEEKKNGLLREAETAAAALVEAMTTRDTLSQAALEAERAARAARERAVDAGKSANQARFAAEAAAAAAERAERELEARRREVKRLVARRPAV